MTSIKVTFSSYMRLLRFDVTLPFEPSQAFLKALNLRAWGEDGNEDDLAALKDRFFTAIKEMPVLAQQPRTNQVGPTLVQRN